MFKLFTKGDAHEHLHYDLCFAYFLSIFKAGIGSFNSYLLNSLSSRGYLCRFASILFTIYIRKTPEMNQAQHFVLQRTPLGQKCRCGQFDTEKRRIGAEIALHRTWGRIVRSTAARSSNTGAFLSTEGRQPSPPMLPLVRCLSNPGPVRMPTTNSGNHGALRAASIVRPASVQQALSLSLPTSPLNSNTKKHQFSDTLQKKTRRRMVASQGEGRSANRSKWSSSPEQPLPSSTTTTTTTTTVDSLEINSSSDDISLVWQCAEHVRPQFAQIDALVHHNIARVQRAFRANRIGPHHFAGSTGYGHGDLGREALDGVMADIMGAEAAAVRIQFVSGTHAIAAALFGCLRPGDELLAVAGSPYDTLEEVIGIRGTPGAGSLAEFGVSYRKLELTGDGSVDWVALATAISPTTRVALVQRSCGYALRPTLSIADIARCVEVIKSQRPDVYVLVDNCYGEFTEGEEPPAVGADLCMGSLIKNPGGTIVSGGGYVAGRAELVARAVARLSAPGVGSDAGCVPGETLRFMFQGLFLAPQMVGEALKGGRLVAEVMSRRGYTVIPVPGPSHPWSFITAVELGSPERMQAFCRAVQECCPIGSYIRPVPGVTPGYDDEVIFADGTFIDGSTAELSADGPLRAPYVVYCQGGTHWTHWALVLEHVLASEN